MAGFGTPRTGTSNPRPTSGINPATSIASQAPRGASLRLAISNQPQAFEFLDQREVGLYRSDSLPTLLNPSCMDMTQIRCHPQVLHLFRIDSHNAAASRIDGHQITAHHQHSGRLRSALNRPVTFHPNYAVHNRVGVSEFAAQLHHRAWNPDVVQL